MSSELHAHHASGVQAMHNHEPERISGSTPPPIVTNQIVPAPSPHPSVERVSNPDHTLAPTQRSVQAPRWVYGALAAIALASGAAGYLLRQPDVAASTSAQPHQPKSEDPTRSPVPPLRQATLTGEGSARVVAATYASPDAKAAAAAPTPAGSPAVATPPEAKPKASEGEAARGMEKPKEAPPVPPGATPPAESKDAKAAEEKEATVAGEHGATAPGPGAATSPEKVVLEEEPEAAAQEAAPAPPAGPFDKEAARIALEVAAARAQGCRKPTDPSGTARIIVTFAPSGRVTSASVSSEPYAGTETGGCVASAFRGAIVPAYAGSPVTVSKTIVIH
jgi:hypothetical protein